MGASRDGNPLEEIVAISDVAARMARPSGSLQADDGPSGKTTLVGSGLNTTHNKSKSVFAMHSASDPRVFASGLVASRPNPI